MFKADEIRRNVSGAWTIMTGDAGGVAELDTTFEGFWRSFALFFVLVPIFLLGMVSHMQALAEDNMAVGPSVPGYVFAVLVARGLEWVAFPAVMALAARPLGLAQHYVPFIVARNWASLIFAAIFTPIYLLHVLGILPTGLIILAGLIILVVGTYFFFRITRICLQVDGMFAAGIITFDIVLTFAIMDLIPEPYAIPS